MVCPSSCLFCQPLGLRQICQRIWQWAQGVIDSCLSTQNLVIVVLITASFLTTLTNWARVERRENTNTKKIKKEGMFLKEEWVGGCERRGERENWRQWKEKRPVDFFFFSFFSCHCPDLTSVNVYTSLFCFLPTFQLAFVYKTYAHLFVYRPPNHVHSALAPFLYYCQLVFIILLFLWPFGVYMCVCVCWCVSVPTKLNEKREICRLPDTSTDKSLFPPSVYDLFTVLMT